VTRPRRAHEHPGPGVVRIRLESTDTTAAEAVLAVLAERFGEDAVTLDAVYDRSAPRRGRDAVPGLAHHYATVTTVLSV
jgi:hypothetical protein